MNFYQATRKFLTSEGYEYLGDEGRLLFYKDKNGRVWGSRESAVAERMIAKGYWGKRKVKDNESS